MCHGYWVSDPFYVTDYPEFEQWISTYWPQAEFTVSPVDEQVRINSNQSWQGYCYVGELPTSRYNPDEDDYDDADETEFLEELSFRLVPNSTVYIKQVWEYCDAPDKLCVIGHVVNADNGYDGFMDRYVVVDLDDAMAQAAVDAAGGQLLLAAQ